MNETKQEWSDEIVQACRGLSYRDAKAAYGIGYRRLDDDRGWIAEVKMPLDSAPTFAFF